jgi:hypothetical protein
MDPQHQIGVVGGVGLPGDRVDAADALVDLADGPNRGIRGRGVAVGGREDEPDGAVEAAPGVGLVVAVLVDSGHGAGLERLHHERPHGGDEHGRVGVEAPGHAVGPEQSDVRHVAPSLHPGDARPHDGAGS